MRLSLLVVLALLVPRVAEAYPQFQLSLGADRCGSCHLSPAGGGLLNDYGRDEASSTVSRGGDGRFLHGAWTPPGWFAIGGDFRLAAVEKYGAGGNQVLFFPMQSDVNTRFGGEHLSFNLTLGVRGASRIAGPPILERVASREHYLTYERDEFLVRAGRFYPVYGLRLADHTAYIRRHLNMYLYEEPYAIELAQYGEKTEAHITAFVPQPTAYLGVANTTGVAALVERQLSESKILGGQARVAINDEVARYMIGSVGKIWLPDHGLLLLAEVDVQRQVFRRAGGGPSRTQVAGYLGASRRLATGLLLTGAVQLWDPDLMLRATTRSAAEVHLQYFPRAHFELHFFARLAAQGELGDGGFLSLLQAHYYL